MADADNTTTTSPDTQSQAGVTKSELDAKLGEIQAQLQAMNSTFQESVQSLASAVAPKQPQPQQRIIQDDDLYDAQKLEQKINVTAGQIANQVVQRERELNTTIYNMAQEYPEIQTDPNVQKAVREAQATLPANFRDTAQGLETAILKAAAKTGLIPKSKRTAEGLDPDFSTPVGRSSGESRRSAQGNGKIDPRTLEMAQLMGRDIDDPNVLKGLEEASKRETWSRYR